MSVCSTAFRNSLQEQEKTMLPPFNQTLFSVSIVWLKVAMQNVAYKLQVALGAHSHLSSITSTVKTKNLTESYRFRVKAQKFRNLR